MKDRKTEVEEDGEGEVNLFREGKYLYLGHYNRECVKVFTTASTPRSITLVENIFISYNTVISGFFA